MQNSLRKNSGRFYMYIVGCLILLFIAIFISVNTGYIDISFLSFIQTLLGNGSPDNALTIFSFRLPRICMAILVGIGIAVSGAILQSISSNPLADPGILGINSGAGFAIVLYTFFIQGLVFSNSWASVFLMPFIALIGALLAAAAIYLLAYKKGKVAPTRMLLVGIGINAAFSAGITIFQLRMEPTDFTRTLVWLSGSIWGSTWTFVLALLPWIVILIPIAFYKARVLDILSLNEMMAIGLGINLTKERKKLLVLAVLLAGACVAVGGGITFLGLIAPHIAKKLVGSSHSRIIPLSALIGALFILISDTISRIVIAPAELPVGIVLSIIGAPYFIYLLLKTRG
ncbi:FecCD family ABC transporter permease [Peribacillus asahii]|uniref:FecCD family ABC transporter permease n=1 Tax=Peribacillus asahii TaxID=228899 RepID=UPI00207AD2CE|nr:iron ABC transporter permease [Peribacillus asahii]USK70469.1 iron ABC transporter permease [Peribacillus asahii]